MTIENKAASPAPCASACSTAGPWEMKPSAADGAHNRRVFAGNEYVATVGGYDQQWKTVVSNAWLIAAAPELLDALKESLALNVNWSETAEEDHLRHLSEYKRVIQQAKAAIEKALGR